MIRRGSNYACRKEIGAHLSFCLGFLSRMLHHTSCSVGTLGACTAYLDPNKGGMLKTVFSSEKLLAPKWEARAIESLGIL